MVSQSQFQLFPHSPPQNRPISSHRRRSSRRRTTRSPDMSPVQEESKPPTQTEAVILKIIEDTNSIISPPDIRVPRAQSPTKSPSSSDAAEIMERVQKPEHAARSQSAPRNGNIQFRPRTSSLYRPLPPTPIPDRPQTASPYSPKLRAASIPAWPAPPRAPTASPFSSPGGRTMTQSPILGVPMRSIFPSYDPNLPLNQQHYYPQRRSDDFPRQMVSQVDYTTSPRSTRHSFALTEAGDTWASIEELAHLWDVANGEGTRQNMGSINLRLCRIDPLTFTLGNRSVPLYSLKTNSRNDIEIHRTHPTKLNSKAPVVTLSLGEISQCNNESVTISLFPKLAEIYAREQALELSRRNQLAPPHAMQAEHDAVRKAEAQEACVLRWNASQGHYDLFHGALPATTDSNNWSSSPGLLHLTISTSPNLPHNHQPTVVITSPGSETNPLMTLDLNTKTLSLSIDTTLTTVPSLYTIDALIATILTVTVLDDTSSMVLREMDVYEPKADDFPNPYRIGSPCSTAPHSRSNSYGQNYNVYTTSPNSTNNLQPHPTTTADIYSTNQHQRPLVPDPEGPDSIQEVLLLTRLRTHSRSRFSQLTKRNRRLNFHFPSLSLRNPWRWVKRTLTLTPEPTEKILPVHVPPRARSRTRTRTTTETQQQQRTVQVPAQDSNIDLERYGNRPQAQPAPSSRRARVAVRSVTWLFSLLVSAFKAVVKFLSWLMVRILGGKKA